MIKMNPHLASDSSASQAGFTLVELIIVIVMLGIVSAVAMMRGTSPSAMTLPSQAQMLAGDIRRAQTLAYTSGNRMQVTATATGYKVLKCSGSNCTTPTEDLSVTLQKGVTFSSFTTTLEFDTLGKPVAGAGYTLFSDSDEKTVTVAATTGFVAHP